MTADWDAIVIGSGLGGLTTAAYLASNGVHPLVLEQSDVVGGFSRMFRRDGFAFDLGLHYVGDCAPGGAIPRMLRGVGAQVDFIALDPDGFSTLVFPDLEFRVPRGWDRYLAALIAAFPREELALRRCVGVLKRIGHELDRVPPPNALSATIAYPLRAPTTMRWGLRPLAALFARCRLSREAGAVISAESGDYATPPSRAPVAAQAGLLHHFLKSGAYYPRGGGEALGTQLVAAIERHGGCLRTHARVEEILVTSGRAAGVRLADGERVTAPVVVSNADLKRTYAELLRAAPLRRRAATRVRRYRMALPLFCVYLGLDCELRERMPSTNFWSFPSTDQEAMYRAAAAGQRLTEPPVFVSSASVKDPDDAGAPPGHSTLELITVAPPGPSAWGASDIASYRDEPAYLHAKIAFANALVTRAAELIPDLRQHVVWQDAATPLTHERRLRSTGGGGYGIEIATDQFGPRRPGSRTEIEGLYLAGASTVWGPGIVGAMGSGVGAAAAILRRDLDAQLRELD